MQLASLQNEGVLYFEDVEDSFESEIALLIDENVEDVRITINFLMANGLLTRIDDNAYELTETKTCIGSETRQAEIMRKTRAQKKELMVSGNNVTKMLPDVTNCYTESELEQEKDKEDGLIDINNYLKEMEFIQNNTHEYNNIFKAKQIYFENPRVLPEGISNQVKLYQSAVKRLCDSHQYEILNKVSLGILEKVLGNVSKVQNITNIEEYYLTSLINEIINKN